MEMDYDSVSPDSPTSPTSDPVTSDIPIHLDGTVRWVTGLTKRTTCDDVIYALLYNDGNHAGETTENYAIFERWRDVEKPLQARTKIVKIWRAWGADQCNVELCVRKLQDNNYISGDSYRPRRRHKRNTTKHRTRHYNDCGCRPGAHRNCYNSRKMGPLESLVKLVIAQERTLHLLGERIWRTDEKIDTLETTRHFSRAKENGDNYVQSVYLDSLSEDSMDEIFGNVRTEDIEEYLAFCEKIIKLEELLSGKHEKLQELDTLLRGTPATCDTVGTSRLYGADPDRMCSEDVEQAEVDMNRLVTAGVMQKYQEASVKRELQQSDRQLEIKRQLIRSLKHDLDSLIEPKGQGRDLESRSYSDMGQGREYVTSASSEHSQIHDNKLLPPEGPANRVNGYYTGSEFNSTVPGYNSNGYNRTTNVFMDNSKENKPAELSPNVNYKTVMFQDGMGYLPARHVMDNTGSDSFDDDSDRVSVIQIFDSPPKNRSKSVTFNDGLNHMHVIGTSRESLSEKQSDPEGSNGVKRTLHPETLATTSYKRYPEYSAPQHKVISILKNTTTTTTNNNNNNNNSSSYKNQVAHNTRPSQTNKQQDLPKDESILNKLASAHDGGRYHLPSGMYTFAKDGHYYLPDTTHRQYKEEDSNSDTGLSSMHSDESPGLETLV